MKKNELIASGLGGLGIGKEQGKGVRQEKEEL